MTPSITAEQMVEIAKKSQPQFTWRLGNKIDRQYYGHVFRTDTYGNKIAFNPCLTSSEREKAQALDCIVAADEINRKKGPRTISFSYQENRPDLLTEALNILRAEAK